MLTRTLRHGFSFNIFTAFKGIKDAIKAPIKHMKAFTEPSGSYYHPQTNTTVQAFDQVSHQWQAFVGHNPFDLQTYNYLENAQLANFGTVDNPLVIFTADAPFRYVGCSGPQNEDDYQSHELLWMMIREGPLQRCGVCGQVFKLVRLRNQFSSEMDYYMPNFNQLWYQDLGEHDTTNNLSITKANTHYEHSVYQQPQNTVYSLISSDQHDRLLVDPAFRIQKQTEFEGRARVYQQAMQDYETQQMLKTTTRQPINKIQYENLIQAEAIIKKLDRQFRKVVKFESRKYVDPVNHDRREKRMLERSMKRWDSSYTLYTGNLTEEQQKYRDYFQTDLERYPEDERLEEFLDKQQVLADPKFRLNAYDFQEGYTIAPQDDQSSYIEKKIFKFKYRKALDTFDQYQRRNQRMIQKQKRRFQQNKTMELITNYIKDPTKYEAQYLKLVSSESVAQYRDYFESDKDELEELLLPKNQEAFSVAFQNWQLPKQDRSTFATLPLPKWNQELGWWANAITILKQVNDVSSNFKQISEKKTQQSISQSSITIKN